MSEESKGSSATKIDAMLKKALKIKDRDRKVLYIVSLAQLLQIEMQMKMAEQAEAKE